MSIDSTNQFLVSLQNVVIDDTIKLKSHLARGVSIMLKNLYHIYDLTHAIDSNMPSWFGKCDFELAVTANYENGYQLHSAAFGKLGCGTHIDAPSHFCATGQAVHELSVEKLICAAHVVHLAEACHEDYTITLKDIINYENKYGSIHENTLVIFNTGWAQYWKNPAKYRNEQADGYMHFPTLGLEAAEYLVKKKIAGMGIDTLSPETGQNGFPIHQLLLGNDVYILENLANCEILPPTEANIIALPPKIHAAAEAPIRVVGLVKK